MVETWKKWLSVWPTGWTTWRTKFDWQPFFSGFYHSKLSKMWKKPVAGFANHSAGQTIHQTEFLPVTVFLRFGLFEVDLETKFSTKILTKKTFELLFDNRWHHHVQLILKFFWSKIFPKNDISNFLRSMSFLRSLSFFEIAVIFLELLSFFEVDINCKPHFRTLPNLTYDNEIPHLSFFGDC